jgi:hypothetical protein
MVTPAANIRCGYKFADQVRSEVKQSTMCLLSQLGMYNRFHLGRFAFMRQLS